MGWPLASVNDLTERELSLWMVRGPLWPRRLELLLIQLTTTLSRVNGGKTKMADFDLFAPQQETALDSAANDLGAFAGAGVHRLGQGRD